MPSSWCRGVLACLVSFSLTACATVPVPDKSYIARAKISGASGSLHVNDGPPLPKELKKKGVLWQGGKIAVLPFYQCEPSATRECFTEIDRFEAALKDSGFWVEPWRDLVSSDPNDPYEKVRARGIEHVIVVDSHELRAESRPALSVSGLTLIEQREAAKPQPLQIKNDDWKIVAPRCIRYFTTVLPPEPQAPVAAMNLRLISVNEERVMWTRKFKEREAVRAPELELYHDLPKEVRSNKAQRNWGIGIASAGVALGVGAAVSAGRASVGTSLILAGVALVSGGLGSWLVYDSRPRESHVREPVDVLCTPEFTKPEKAKGSETSSQFEVAQHSSGGEPDLVQIALERAKRLETVVINDAAKSLSKLKRPGWAKPKKDKGKKKKDKSDKKEDDRVSALACRWEDQELRCRAACTRCKDPWEGPCEICKPPKEGQLSSIPVPPKRAKSKEKKRKGEAPAMLASQADESRPQAQGVKESVSKEQNKGDKKKEKPAKEKGKGEKQGGEHSGEEPPAGKSKSSQDKAAAADSTSKSSEGNSEASDSAAEAPQEQPKPSKSKSAAPESASEASEASDAKPKSPPPAKEPAGEQSSSKDSNKDAGDASKDKSKGSKSKKKKKAKK